MTNSHFPKDPSLPIYLLASVFNNTTASYKYYWFLSILNHVERDELSIPYRYLFARMVSKSWYTINYFNLSFGVSDKLQDAIKAIRTVENIDIHIEEEALWELLVQSENRETQKQLAHFKRQVPHWFLAPWYPSVKERIIKESSREKFGQPIYSLMDDHILLNKDWIHYLRRNIKFLREFTLWNLSQFIQRRNPNVPNIISKLERPSERNPLTKQRKFWNHLIKEGLQITCIYTGETITLSQYDIEHFIPHSFVMHNLLWNLIPSNPNFNRSKNSKLPNIDIHLERFIEEQYKTVSYADRIGYHPRIIEDYYTVIPMENFKQCSFDYFRDKMMDNLIPQHTIAKNNGFEVLQ